MTIAQHTIMHAYTDMTDACTLACPNAENHIVC